jgi:Tectonin domain
MLGFEQVPGSLRQITVGSFGPWGINADQDIFSFDGQVFKQIPGKLAQVAAGGGSLGRGDEVWGINASSKIFRFNGAVFEEVPGLLTQIVVGGNASVWGISGIR